jgi:hypothetical protein
MYADKQTTGMNSIGGSTRPVSTMEDATASVHARISELEASFANLTQRLSSVLQPSPPKQEQSTGALNAVSPHSQAISEIHVMKVRLEDLINRVNETTGRLET